MFPIHYAGQKSRQPLKSWVAREIGGPEGQSIHFSYIGMSFSTVNMDLWGWFLILSGYFLSGLAPIIELLGIIYFIAVAILGVPNWPFFFVMLFFVYVFAITFSTYAILYDLLAYNRYKKKRMIVKLLLTAWIETNHFPSIGCILGFAW